MPKNYSENLQRLARNVNEFNGLLVQEGCLNRPSTTLTRCKTRWLKGTIVLSWQARFSFRAVHRGQSIKLAGSFSRRTTLNEFIGQCSQLAQKCQSFVGSSYRNSMAGQWCWGSGFEPAGPQPSKLNQLLWAGSLCFGEQENQVILEIRSCPLFP